MLPGGDTVNPPKPATPTAEQEERKRLEAAVMHIRERLDKDAFASTARPGRVHRHAGGLRIDLLEKDDSSFFDTGSAALHGETEHILAVIAHELGTLDHQVVSKATPTAAGTRPPTATRTGSCRPTAPTPRGA